ncbi:uncharacterized protein LOC124887259 isoform X2 [Capsicum annuum]|uniref:uncharacterized protein LOC124887259 isoform X2 n=1 Tax=Capsicum annuum TaxID=4072 RepID=UPI001FB16DE2|nr:uncharacterized protein LOC124887259 isoform X2 [Capsicum annuum]
MDCIFSSFLLKICSPLPKKLRSSRRGPCIQKTTTNNNKNISSEIPQMRSTCMEKVEGTLSHGCREAVSKRLSARVQQIQATKDGGNSRKVTKVRGEQEKGLDCVMKETFEGHHIYKR